MAQTMNEYTINWQAVGEETIARTRDLLRLDTRNPPGNEIRAAEYLRDLFEAEGISGEIVGPQPDRATFVARLKGDGSAPPLLLMSHTDVVAVEPESDEARFMTVDLVRARNRVEDLVRGGTESARRAMEQLR